VGNARGFGERGVALQPAQLAGRILRHAVVGHHQRRAGLQAPVQLAQRVQALRGIEEVQGQQAAGTIEAQSGASSM
jgi:hypothetical protein